MNFSAVPSLINFLGFALGIALNAVLLVMVVRHPIRVFPNEENGKSKFTVKWMLLATAILGLLWNFGNLAELAWRDYWSGEPSPFLAGAAYAALGFLPAVVVQSEWLATIRTEKDFKTQFLTIAAYVLSGIAAVLQFRAAAVSNFVPSVFALQILTVGYLAILASLFLTTRSRAARSAGANQPAFSFQRADDHRLSDKHRAGPRRADSRAAYRTAARIFAFDRRISNARRRIEIDPRVSRNRNGAF
jgi:hypothetical protein